MTRPFVSVMLGFVLIASGCTAVARADSAPTSEPATTTTGEPPIWDTVPDAASYIASLRAPVSVYHSPGGVQVAVVDKVTGHGTPRSMAVVGEPGEEWTQVMLDQRPNESVGWVRTADVDITWTTLRIEVDLDQRELRLFDGDQLIVRGDAAIGRQSSPTPRGTTFVTDVLATPEPDTDTLYGPFAIGLGMYSDVVTEYAGGNGQIGIHGTTSPELLGTEVSLGCARVHNDVIRALAGRVPIGTPVVII